MRPAYVLRKMEDKESKYFQFDGTNFNTWKFRMNSVLDQKGLVDYVMDDLEFITLHATDREYRKYIKEEKQCKALLIKHIADNQLECIKDKTTAKEIYETLESIFERKSVAGQLLLRKKLITMKYDGVGDMKSHLFEFDKTIRELKAIGAKLEEMDVICHLLLTLPKSYNTLVTAIETLNPETLNMDFVRSRLLDEHGKRNIENKHFNEHSIPTAMAAFKYRCHNCGKLGHRKWECPNKENSSESKKSANIAEDEESDGRHFL